MVNLSNDRLLKEVTANERQMLKMEQIYREFQENQTDYKVDFISVSTHFMLFNVLQTFGRTLRNQMLICFVIIQISFKLF